MLCILLGAQDFALAGWLTGKVTNQASGLPVVGADVEGIGIHGLSFSKIYKTDSGGNYWIQTNIAGDYLVRVDMKVTDPLADQYYGGGVKKSTAQVVNLPKSNEWVYNLDIALPPGYPIVGTVSAGGVALPNIDMDVFSADGEFLVTYNAVTASNGYYEIGPLPDGDYLVKADPDPLLGQTQIEGFYSNTSDILLATPVTISGGFRSGIDIDLKPGGIITGTITDTGAKFLPGIDLDLFDSNGMLLTHSGTTGADGVYAIGPLPAGSYFVKADPDITSGYVHAYYPAAFSLNGAEKLLVEINQTTGTIDFDLELGGTISGLIRDAQTLDPLPGIDLDVYDKLGNPFNVTVRSALDGTYTIGRLPVGTYFLKADPDEVSGYIGQYYDTVLAKSSATPIAVMANQDTPNIHFDLQQGGWITGIVLDSIGIALAGIDLDIYSATGARIDATVVTALDGTFSLGPIPDGDYFVRADPDPLLGQFYVETYYGGTADRASSTIVTVSGGTASGIDFNLQAGGAISGTIRDSGGSPLVGFDLDIYDSFGNKLPYDSTSGLGGSYVIGPFPAGQYLLKCDSPDNGAYVAVYHDAVLKKGDATPISVTVDTLTTDIDFNLFTGGSITGTILDANGAPLDGIDLDVYDATGALLDVSATTVAGAYTLGPLPDGDYFLKADPDPALGQFNVDGFFGGGADKNTATAITIAGGDATGIDLNLEAGGVISGTIRDTDGLPLGGIDLDIFNPAGNKLPYTAITAADGTYLIGPIPAGEYLLKSDAPAISGFTGLYYPNAVARKAATPIPVVVDANTANIDFNLFQGGWISGTIRGDAGSPLDNVDLDVFDALGLRMDVTARTALDGTYTVGPLPAGDYRVRADPDDLTGYLILYYPNAFKSADATAVAVTASSTLPDIDFSLPVAGWIEGLVTDELGNPLVDIDLDLFNAATFGRLTKGGTTGADGRYKIGPLPVQDILVRADPSVDQLRVREYYSEEVSLRSSTPVAITGGTGTLDVDFTLELGSFISGRVVDPAGAPIVGADIDVFRLSDLFLMDQNAKTQADGTYIIGPLPEGTYILKFDALASSVYSDVYYDGTADPVSATPIVLTAGSNITDLDSNLPEFILFPDVVIELDGDTPEVVFDFETDSGKFYHIEYSDTLLPDSWVISTTLVGDEFPANYREEIPPTVSRRFFRIRITTF